MAPIVPRIPASRIVVIMPKWLGDGVMATPFLRALRELYPDAQITAVAGGAVSSALAGLSSIDALCFDVAVRGRPDWASRQYLRSAHFDLGILLPNSFRSAWRLWRGGVSRRLGYARDWRTPLLTDYVRPLKRSAEQRAADQRKSRAIREISGGKVLYRVGSAYQPVPTIEYYLGLATYLGARSPSKKMELAISSKEFEEADSALASIEKKQSRITTLITLVPGANFGSSKCWPPEYFAKVADELVDQYDAHVMLASSPAEMPIIDAILAASVRKTRVVALAKLNAPWGVSLGALKEIVRRSKLMVCNDTGPRHFAAALGVPVLTLFGPTDPVWAETFVENERQVRIDVPCGPCQLKKCPIDHRCMTGLGPEMVLSAATGLLSEYRTDR